MGATDCRVLARRTVFWHSTIIQFEAAKNCIREAEDCLDSRGRTALHWRTRKHNEVKCDQVNDLKSSGFVVEIGGSTGRSTYSYDVWTTIQAARWFRHKVHFLYHKRHGYYSVAQDKRAAWYLWKMVKVDLTGSTTLVNTSRTRESNMPRRFVMALVAFWRSLVQIKLFSPGTNSKPVDPSLGCIPHANQKWITHSTYWYNSSDAHVLIRIPDQVSLRSGLKILEDHTLLFENGVFTFGRSRFCCQQWLAVCLPMFWVEFLLDQRFDRTVTPCKKMSCTCNHRYEYRVSQSDCRRVQKKDLQGTWKRVSICAGRTECIRCSDKTGLTA